MIGIHEHVVRVIDVHKDLNESSVLLVSVLELLSRVEVIGQLDEIRVLRAKLFQLIAFDSEKIRNLAAKSIARFHEFYEVEETIDRLLSELFQATSENSKHGIVITIFYLLKKYESDVRYTGNVMRAKDLLSYSKTLVSNHFVEGNSSYYVRCYLLNLLLFMGFDIFDRIVMKIIFECENMLCREDVENHLLHLDEQCRYNQFGFDMWKQRIQNVYLDRKLREELEI